MLSNIFYGARSSLDYNILIVVLFLAGQGIEEMLHFAVFALF